MDPTTVFVSHITSTTELMCAKFAVTNAKPVRRALTIVFLAKVPTEGQRLRVCVCRSSSTMESTQIARRVCTTVGHAPMAPPVPHVTIRRDAPWTLSPVSVSAKRVSSTSQETSSVVSVTIHVSRAAVPMPTTAWPATPLPVELRTPTTSVCAASVSTQSQAKNNVRVATRRVLRATEAMTMTVWAATLLPTASPLLMADVATVLINSMHLGISASHVTLRVRPALRAEAVSLVPLEKQTQVQVAGACVPLGQSMCLALALPVISAPLVLASPQIAQPASLHKTDSLLETNVFANWDSSTTESTHANLVITNA